MGIQVTTTKETHDHEKGEETVVVEKRRRHLMQKKQVRIPNSITTRRTTKPIIAIIDTKEKDKEKEKGKEPVTPSSAVPLNTGRDNNNNGDFRGGFSLATPNGRALIDGSNAIYDEMCEVENDDDDDERGEHGEHGLENNESDCRENQDGKEDGMKDEVKENANNDEYFFFLIKIYVLIELIHINI